VSTRFCVLALAASALLAQQENGGLKVPLKPQSVRFAVIGDSGTGEKAQYEVAQQMAAFRKRFPFDFVLMLGDNIYGSDRPSDFKSKFEDAYAPLLGAGVKFFASLGNHDNPNERFYAPFNMGGKRYYSFRKGDAEFFGLDSNYMDPDQLEWAKKELKGSKATWKICFFHHPLYSDGKYHGPDVTKGLSRRRESSTSFSAVPANCEHMIYASHQTWSRDSIPTTYSCWPRSREINSTSKPIRGQVKP
jgi:hypothetical protein